MTGWRCCWYQVYELSNFVAISTFFIIFLFLSCYWVESLCLFFSPFYSALDCFVQIGNHLERSLYNLVENASCSEHLCTHVRHCLFSFASFELSVGCRGHRGIWVIASRQITCIFFALLLNSWSWTLAVYFVLCIVSKSGSRLY